MAHDPYMARRAFSAYRRSTMDPRRLCARWADLSPEGRSYYQRFARLFEDGALQGTDTRDLAAHIMHGMFPADSADADAIWCTAPGALKFTYLYMVNDLIAAQAARGAQHEHIT